MSYLLIIPARYKSKRFPGKPLKKIYGKEMISYVWEKCISAVPKENVLIATDNKKKFSTLNKTTKFSNLFNRDEKKINKLLFDFSTCKTTIKNIFV